MANKKGHVIQIDTMVDSIEYRKNIRRHSKYHKTIIVRGDNVRS